MQFRESLMIALVKYIQAEDITQKEAGKRLGVTQSRISNLVHGKVDLFSTSMLLDIVERAGFEIYEKIESDVKEIVEHQSWLGTITNSDHSSHDGNRTR